MNFTLTPSLEHITAVKIATTLWSQDDVKFLMVNYISQLFKGDNGRHWQQIEDKVLGKVLLLSYPVQLKGKIAGCIKPVGLQILNWIEDEYCVLDEVYVTTNLSRLMWTQLGTVDKRKTAQVLVKDENVDVIIRYNLACIYCFEDSIQKLWSKIPEDSRKRLYDEENPAFFHQHTFVCFWTFYMKQKLVSMGDVLGQRWLSCSPFQCAFEFAVNISNKAATEYFLPKLTPNEAKQSIAISVERIANRSRSSIERSQYILDQDADILCFLLSQMDEEERKKLFERKPHQILGYLLEWPWQSLFMEVANHMWDSIPKKHYYILLGLIVDKVIDGFVDFDYQDTFRKFWQRISKTHKRYVLDDCKIVFLLEKLFSIKDEITIKLIFENATKFQKRKLIFCETGLNICQSLVECNEWNLLELFIKGSVKTEGEIQKFRETFKDHIRLFCLREELAKKADKWSKFHQLLDGLICEKVKCAVNGVILIDFLRDFMLYHTKK